MANKVYVGQKCTSFESKGEFPPVSRVTMHVNEELSYTAGDDAGRTIELDCRGATQQIVNNVLEKLRGFVYRPYEAKGAVLDPAAELGDAVTVGGIYSIIGTRTTNLATPGISDISAPGALETGHEYKYLTPTERELKKRIKEGQKYQGVSITRLNGLTIVETDGETEGAKVVLNSKELSFYDGEGGRVLYFDPTSGTYKFLGELNVNDKFVVDKLGNVRMDGSVNIGGSLIMSGTSNWLMTRYSTNKNAPVPDGWTEAWDSAWNNTSTQVWAIYSYNGGAEWKPPVLVQGKDGDRGPTGPSGSDANVPAWVQAYTSSAQFNTLVTNEWVVSMNLFGSKIFGGAFYDASAVGRLNLSNSSSTFSDLIFTNEKSGKELFKIKDLSGVVALHLNGIPVIEASTLTGGHAYLTSNVEVQATFG